MKLIWKNKNKLNGNIWEPFLVVKIITNYIILLLSLHIIIIMNVLCILHKCISNSHLNNLTGVLKRLITQKNNTNLNPFKFGCTKVNYLLKTITKHKKITTNTKIIVKWKKKDYIWNVTKKCKWKVIYQMFYYDFLYYYSFNYQKYNQILLFPIFKLTVVQNNYNKQLQNI